MLLENRETGKLVIVDEWIARMRRMKRRVFAWSDAARSKYDPEKHKMIFTRLSYRPGDAWRALDISEYIQEVRKHLDKNLRAYAWVAELQERGAVHYHVLLIINKTSWLPNPDTSKMWKHGLTHQEKARNPIAYLCKYASKGGDESRGVFPRGIHLWAVWIQDEFIDPDISYQFKMSARPYWIEETLKDNDLWGTRIKKVAGGWELEDAGELSGIVIRSPWQVYGRTPGDIEFYYP
jgi:hypothetical protein